MKARWGTPKAITATAHKLARLIYTMLQHGTAYVRQNLADYEHQYRIVAPAEPFLGRPLFVTRHTTPESGFFAFLPPCQDERRQQSVPGLDLIAVFWCPPRWLHHTLLEVPSSRT
jgi:hypothetical protein